VVASICGLAEVPVVGPAMPAVWKRWRAAARDRFGRTGPTARRARAECGRSSGGPPRRAAVGAEVVELLHSTAPGFAEPGSSRAGWGQRRQAATQLPVTEYFVNPVGDDDFFRRCRVGVGVPARRSAPGLFAEKMQRCLAFFAQPGYKDGTDL